MINLYINEITVWADRLEDEGKNVSLLRLLSNSNYLCPSILSDDYYFPREKSHGDGNGANLERAMNEVYGDGHGRFRENFDTYFMEQSSINGSGMFGVHFEFFSSVKNREVLIL